MEQTKKKPLGRPPSTNPHTEMLHVRVTPDMMEWMYRIAEDRLDAPTQAALVREALAEYVERYREKARTVAK